uniref:Uncharacterized protein n=1 Tax=Oryza sativa subsp. japonica TaxID=39947 RepID=Q6H4A9_ORYSJ|nr:unknown protein [Oryza sativa Japonica Group]
MLPSFFLTNNTGAPQGDELGRTNPFSCNSLICFLSSSNSLTGIRYGLLDMGVVPGIRSIVNSMSRSSGIPGKSSGNTSGNRYTTGIPFRGSMVNMPPARSVSLGS